MQMDATQIQMQIDIYAAGGRKLVDAYNGLSQEHLLAIPIPGTWSLQQIAIHLLDSDLIGADRMKRIAAMDRPLLIGYDETAFNNLPGVEDLDAKLACQMFDQFRQMTASILRRLADESFSRFGIHNEDGKVTLAEMVAKYNKHLDGHLVHVAQKVAMLKKSTNR